jgi:hypothetical protein
MAAKNDITGDSIQTRTITDTYRNNYDLIFGKKKNDTSTADNTVRDVQPTDPDSQPQKPADEGTQL